MKVIFLDVDGVLTSDYYVNSETNDIDTNKVKLLQEIKEETGAKIVLNSSYKNYKGKDKNKNPYNLLEGLLKKFNIDIYDITPILKRKPLKKGIDPETGLKIIDVAADPYTTRAGAVYKWLNEHEDVESFVIIDDISSYYDFFNYEDNFIKVNREIVLTKENTHDAIDILNNRTKKR